MTSSSSCTRRRTSTRSRRSCAAGGRPAITQSTPVVPRSWGAALAAAGTALAATEAVLDGECDLRLRARAAARPPRPAGDQPTATASSRTPRWRPSWRGGAGVERVAIIDWDVHHGNGTQAVLLDRGRRRSPSRCTCAHGSWGPHHPQTGARRTSSATGDGAGRNVNVELARRHAATRGTAGPWSARRRAARRRLRARAARDRVRAGREPVRPQRAHVRHDGRLPRPRRDRPASWPTATATGAWCSCRRAATAAPTRRSACTRPSRACWAPGPLLDDPMAYLPDDATAVTPASRPCWPRSGRTGAGSRHDRRRRAALARHRAPPPGHPAGRRRSGVVPRRRGRARVRAVRRERARGRARAGRRAGRSYAAAGAPGSS